MDNLKIIDNGIIYTVEVDYYMPEEKQTHTDPGCAAEIGYNIISMKPESTHFNFEDIATDLDGIVLKAYLDDIEMQHD
jgi:hypothetical protein